MAKKKKVNEKPVAAIGTPEDITPENTDWSPSEPSGYEPSQEANDTIEAFAAVGARDFPDHLWIEPGRNQQNWKDIAELNDKYHTWPEDWRNRFTNQTPTHECTCHALVQNMEIAWNRQRGAKKDAVWFSPLSVYAEANPRRWGGSTMQYTLSIAAQRGILPEHDGPDANGQKAKGFQKDKFEHTMWQTSGNAGEWVSLSRFPTGWKQTARHFKPLEIINVSSWEQHVCLILQGICVSNGRAGHAIPHVKIIWRGNDIYSMYSDSYDVHRYDSLRYIKMGVGGAYAIVTTTTPDDWNNPTNR